MLVPRSAGVMLTGPAITARAGRWLVRNYGRLYLRARLLLLLCRLLPINLFGRARAALLRLAGAQIGPRSFIYGPIELHAGTLNCTRLQIGSDIWISAHCSFDLNDDVVIGNNVVLGHHVVIVTASHVIGPPERRCGAVVAQPVMIGDGAWIGARSTILPGVTIGAGSVVCAGTTVHRDVPPNTMAGGAPMRVIRDL